ncbi:MAG TPA: hypothetical protein VIA81_05100 [Acidimicrobiia bacterium]|jgi:uncharacterized membrane protein
MRDIALWLHILGGGTWIGANLTQAALSRRMTGGEPSVAVRWLEAVNKMSGPLYGTAAVVILATGIYLVLSSDSFTFGSVFVGIGIAVLVIGGVLAGLIFTPTTKRAITAFSAGNTSEGRSLMTRFATFGTIDTLLVVVAVLAMVAKWGA